MNMIDSIEKSILDFNDPNNFDKNQEHTYLDNLLLSIRKNPKYSELLAEH
jgi:hypothetical protein